MLFGIILFISVSLLILVLVFVIKKINNKETFVGGGIVSSLCNNKGYVYKNDESSPSLNSNDIPENLCYCIDGWSGDKCTFSTCSGHGKLYEYSDASGNSFQKCLCDKDFKGDYCQYSDAITCNGKGTVSDAGICTCNPSIYGKFCNNICKNGKTVDNNCVCKKEKMYFKDNINTNQVYKFQDLYTGDNCNDPVKLSDLKDIENLYRDELPSDDKNENYYVIKICPFNKDISLENFNVKINGILPFSVIGTTDNNGCYIIDLQKYNNYIPECISAAQSASAGLQYIGIIGKGKPSSSGTEGKTSSTLCSPIKFSALLGSAADITFDVVNRKRDTKESANVYIVYRAAYTGIPVDIKVDGLSNYYIRKGIPDRFLAQGSAWQMPIGFLSDLHSNHDPNARAFNIIVGDYIDGCSPNCSGKVCGDDGCGGTCGTCPVAGQVCNKGVCCSPNCSGKVCGDNGCGGSCGTCPTPGQVCKNGICCTPNCTGKVCGDDGCGGSCGTCPSGISCINNGTKCCAPVCSGDCGPDGCGGICGTCRTEQTCSNGVCCTPNCLQLCGQDDGCGSKCSSTLINDKSSSLKWSLICNSGQHDNYYTVQLNTLNFVSGNMGDFAANINLTNDGTNSFSMDIKIDNIQSGISQDEFFIFIQKGNYYQAKNSPNIKIFPNICK
jgi:hypothetical protein